MTNEQAVDLLDNLIGFVEDSRGNDYDSALKMAIEALSAQPEPSWDCEKCMMEHTDEMEKLEAELAIAKSKQPEPCEDAISRQAAIDALEEERCPCESDYDEGYLSMLDKAIWIMKDWLSSAEPERKKGRWIDQDDGAFYPVECSECRKIPLFDVYGDYILSNFCPNCGADMREETTPTKGGKECG